MSCHRTDVTLPHPDAIPSDQPCWLPGMSKSSFLPSNPPSLEEGGGGDGGVGIHEYYEEESAVTKARCRVEAARGNHMIQRERCRMHS